MLTDRILPKRIVPVAVIETVKDAVPLANALVAAGLDIIEVTLRTPVALDCIREIRRGVPQMLVGAGTILQVEQVDAALKAGAGFGVSPGLNEAVVQAAQRAGLPFIPGVMTPTEVERALALGCRLLKFFPADLAGSVNMLNAWRGPYGHTGVKFIPLGGINRSNAAQYLALPNVAAVGGSWIVDRKHIAAQDWEAIRSLAAEALAIAKPAAQA